MAAQGAAVAVVGVFAHTHVGDDVKIGIRCLDFPNGLLNHALRVPGGRAYGILVGGNAKQNAAANAGGDALGYGFLYGVQTILILSRQRINRALAAEGFVHENGVNQAVGGKPGLPAHPADGVAVPQAAGSLNEFHGYSPSTIR